MKLKAVTTIAMITGLLAASAHAGGLNNFQKTVRTVGIINHVLNGNSGPAYGPGYNPGPGYGQQPGPVIQPLPYPGPQAPVCQKPLPPAPPVCHQPQPLPQPQPPVCHKPQPIPQPQPLPCPCPQPQPQPQPQPPVCHKPQPQPPVCHKPICQPPQQNLSLKLHNRAGAEVYYSLNQGEYQTLKQDAFNTYPAAGGNAPVIEYRYGDQVVQRELNPNGEYAFEWQGDVLALIEVQG